MTGEHAFHEGDPSRLFYIIEEGKLKVESSKMSGAVELGPGKCFGEMGLLSGEPRNAAVSCASKQCRLVTLQREDFLKLMKRSSVLQTEMQGVASARRSQQLPPAQG